MQKIWLALAIAVAAWFGSSADWKSDKQGEVIEKSVLNDYRRSDRSEWKVVEKPPQLESYNQSGTDLMLNVAAVYREKYETRLEHPYWQVKMLGDMMQRFRQRYPQDWHRRLQQFLVQSFPLRHSHLMERLDSLLQYEDWLEQAQGLTFSSVGERMDNLWQTRLILFGEDAYQIWEGEYREQKFQQHVDALAVEIEGDVDLVFERYLVGFAQIYGKDPKFYSDIRKAELLKRFLEISDVRQEVNTLTYDERANLLHDFRQQLGMSEAAVERWRRLELRRDSDWRTGQAYYQAAESVRKKLSGPELEEALKDIRREYFEAGSADAIAREEAAGFFRFSQDKSKWP